MSTDTKIKASLGQKAGAAAYLLFCAILRVLDIRLVAIFGRCIGYLAWAAMPGRRRIVARNIRIVAGPTLRGKKLSDMVRRNIVRTCMNMACTFKTGLMTDKELQSSVRLVGAEAFEAMAANGDCVIGCIPHAGNWEILARIRPLFPKVKRFGSMYRRLDNPVLEDIVYKSRTRYGCEMFSSQKGLKEVFRLAKDGGMLGVLSDQFTQQGIFLPYFGKVTGTTPLPSLIYKRCRGKGHLLAVSTRNTGLGKWDAVLCRLINTENSDSEDMTDITLAVNEALAEAQKESILDGFWMHHRWKSTSRFAPNVDDAQREIIRKHCTLPFRIIICVPECFDEAIYTIPFMRELQACRPDMQLNIVCPAEQKAFWETQAYVANVVTTENPLQQLESEELYKDGPYDYLFMLSENRKVFSALKKLMPIYISGFNSNPFRKKFRTKFVLPVGAGPQHRTIDYILLAKKHIPLSSQVFADPSTGNASATGNFIAPFSTLGKADSWEDSKWVDLISRLEGDVKLLAFESDREQAEAKAKDWEIPCVLVKPETVASTLGPQCRLYTVDGLLPQLAALVGCPCNVIMSTRLAAVYAPADKVHKIVYRHVPCHPCYRTDCDQDTPCSAGVSVDEFLTK